MCALTLFRKDPDSKVHGTNMGPTWVLSSPGEPHDGHMDLVSGEALTVVPCTPCSSCWVSDQGVILLSTDTHSRPFYHYLSVFCLQNIGCEYRIKASNCLHICARFHVNSWKSDFYLNKYLIFTACCEYLEEYSAQYTRQLNTPQIKNMLVVIKR